MADGNYNRDRQRGDALMPEVKRIVGAFLLTDDCGDEDLQRNTDLMILDMREKRVGVRVREYSIYRDHPDWRNQFTIRYERVNGCKTEFEKIMDGWGDYFFYGFKDETGTHFKKWIIGQFPAFRHFVNHEICAGGWNDFVNKRKRRNTGEDGSYFLVFELDEIKDFVVASSEERTTV